MKKIKNKKVFNYIKGSSEKEPRQKLEKLYGLGNIYIVKRDGFKSY